MRPLNLADDAARFKHVCLAVVLLIIGLAMVFSDYSKIDYVQGTLGRTKLWELPSSWQQVECTVLAAGVACTEVDTGSICTGYKGGPSYAPSNATLVFNTEAIASCPGSYWCAKEQELCSCNGEIAYAPHLFDGHGYTIPSTDKVYSRSSTGTVPIKCGTNSKNQPYTLDPAPGVIKHCWCTPRTVVDLIKNGSLHKASCDEMATLDFMLDIDAQGRLVQRRLRQVDDDNERRKPTPADDLDAADSLVDEGEGSDEQDPRRLFRHARHHTPRRRRTFTYSPSALVEVALPEDQDTFATNHGKKFQRQQTCAYEFGVPMADYGVYTSDGPYGGGGFSSDVWQVEDKVKRWGAAGKSACWVRTVGRSAELGSPCAVAMEKPGALQTMKSSSLGHAKILLWSSLAAVSCCFCWAIYVCISVVCPSSLGSTDASYSRVATDAPES